MLLSLRTCDANCSTYQVSEVPLDHELQRLRGARRVPRHHRVACHDSANLRSMRVQTLSSDLERRVAVPEICRAGTTRTLYARSLAVKIPLRPSSSSTTSTQSVLLAAHS